MTRPFYHLKSNTQHINNNFKEFKALRDSLNDFYIKANLIIRFLFLGNGKFRYGTDALVYGTVDDFLWATKSEILKFLLIYPQKRNFNLNIGALNIKSYDRNLKNDLKKIKRQNTVQVKWPTIKEDLLCIEQLRNVFYNESKIFYQK